MTPTLSHVGHADHDRVLAHVNQLPEVADRLLTEKGDAFRQDVDAVCGYLVRDLVPHVDETERTLYP